MSLNFYPQIKILCLNLGVTVLVFLRAYVNGTVFWVEQAVFMDVIDLNVCSRAPLELEYFSFPRVVWDTEINTKLLAGFLPLLMLFQMGKKMLWGKLIEPTVSCGLIREWGVLIEEGLCSLQGLALPCWLLSGFCPGMLFWSSFYPPGNASSAALAAPWCQFGDLGHVLGEDSTAGAAAQDLGMQQESHLGVLEEKRFSGRAWSDAQRLLGTAWIRLRESCARGAQQAELWQWEEQGASSTHPQAGSWLSQGWDLG